MLNKIKKFLKNFKKTNGIIRLVMVEETFATYCLILEGHDVQYVSISDQDAINHRMTEREVLENKLTDMAEKHGIEARNLNVVWEQL